jgi:hypothetical protein
MTTIAARRAIPHVNPLKKVTFMRVTLREMARVHLAMIRLLDTSINSIADREQVEVLRDELEQEMADLECQQRLVA